MSLMESPEVLANIVCQVRTGRAIIFNHEVYTNKMLPRRHGTEKDMEKLKITLKKYNFQVEVRDDQSVRKIRKYLGKVQKIGLLLYINKYLLNQMIFFAFIFILELPNKSRSVAKIMPRLMPL